MPKKIVKKGKSKKDLKEEFRKMLIESIINDGKKAKKECTSSCKPDKKKVSKPVKKRVSKIVGGSNFIKDLQRAGKGLGLSMQHTFQSMSNLGKDMYCETEAIMNIGNELDLGYTKDCPFTKTKSWDYNKIKQ